MILIFYMSSMSSNESNDKSMKTIDKAIESTIEVTNKAKITDTHPSEGKLEALIIKLNQPLRKVVHAGEYLVLSILLIVLLTTMGIKGKKVYFITIITCFLYACTDEYHQTFVVGRSGRFIDTLIDTTGGVIGCILVTLKNKFFKKNKES